MNAFKLEASTCLVHPWLCATCEHVEQRKSAIKAREAQETHDCWRIAEPLAGMVQDVAIAADETCQIQELQITVIAVVTWNCSH